ncbi:MAG TPA: hypothetical protein PLR25_15540, partial [Planctomycetaceae bacterium]|nr:hypothetical protein [Planctomycetaceae bacterium]
FWGPVASSPSELTNPDEPDGVAAKVKVHAIAACIAGATELIFTIWAWQQNDGQILNRVPRETSLSDPLRVELTPPVAIPPTGITPQAGKESRQNMGVNP